jgi:Bor protein
MIRKFALAATLIAALSLSSCYTMTHQVGSGGTGVPQSDQQWWILGGLVPLNHVDSHAIAGNATNYTVTTQFKPLDVIISLFTGFVTIYVQTVEVQK